MPIRAALLAEGPSDRGLIGVLVRVCSSRGWPELTIDWGADVLMHHESSGLSARIEKLLELDPGYDLLFIHRDADSEDPKPRLDEIEQAVSDQPQCPPFVCVVPVQELEAWLLVDENAILTQVGKRAGAVDLGLPKPKHLERRARPKELLQDALALANAKRGRPPKLLSRREFGLARANLLAELDIDGPINQLGAWQRLLTDIDIVITTITVVQLDDELEASR